MKRTWAELISQSEDLVERIGKDAVPMIAALVTDWVRADERARRDITTINGVCPHCHQYPCVGHGQQVRR